MCIYIIYIYLQECRAGYLAAQFAFQSWLCLTVRMLIPAKKKKLINYKNTHTRSKITCFPVTRRHEYFISS